METITSADGTRIAYERAGTGPAVILLPGAFNDHTTCAPVAAELVADHTVVAYDRRARGQSGDTAPYAIEREVEDLTALIELVGGTATVLGYSSGAILALKAAADGAPISGLALYEPPFAFGGSPHPDMPARLAALVADSRPGDAVELFQREAIGLPPELVEQMKHSPLWPVLSAMARSLVYDSTITTELAVPTDAMTSVTTPTLILNGAQTWPVLREAALQLAKLMPAARHVELPGGENHAIPPAETAAALRTL
jgi:pimeloyl-ACP methyl ester carboxylesterase